MGTPASCNAFVQFDTPENAAEAFFQFTQWAIEANDGKKDGDFGITIDEIIPEESAFRYTVDSGRYQNCIWQCEQIRDFLKTQKGVQSIEQDVMTCEDSISWSKDEDE